MIAIDTSVLVDLLAETDGAAAAETTLRQALSQGPVVACAAVVAEIVAGLGHGSQLIDALEEAGISYSELEYRSAVRAGEMQRRHRERARAEPATPRRSMTEFMIGAHAQMQCQGLITRDPDFYRQFFKGLKLIVPLA